MVAVTAILQTPFAERYFVYRYLSKVKNKHHEKKPVKLEKLMDLHLVHVVHGCTKTRR